MIDVTDAWWWAILIAAIAGLIGGLIYELMQARLGESGMVEFGSRQAGENGRRYVDLGALASLLIGAVAAVVFLYFMPPTEFLESDTQRVVRREYDAFRLIPATLLVGSAGGAFMTAMQERFKRAQLEGRSNAAADILADGAATSSADGGGDDEMGMGPSMMGGGAHSTGKVSNDTVSAALRALGK